MIATINCHSKLETRKNAVPAITPKHDKNAHTISARPPRSINDTRALDIFSADALLRKFIDAPRMRTSKWNNATRNVAVDSAGIPV